MNIKKLVAKLDNKYSYEDVMYIKEFLSALDSAGKSENTVSAYFRDLKVFFDFKFDEPYLKNLKLNELAPININMYYSYLISEKNNSSLSITRKKYVLKLFFEFLVEQKILKDSPIPKESVIKSANKIKSKNPTYLEIDEIRKLNSIIISHYEDEFVKARNFFIINLFLHTGLRISELLSLDIKDMELSSKRHYLSVIGKGDKERIIPIDIIALSEELSDEQNLIQNYFDFRNTMKSDDNALFISNRGKRLTPRYIQQELKHLTALAGIDKKITPHKLRHTFATFFLRNGANIRLVQEVLGHASISTTQIYTHTDKQDLIKAMKESNIKY